MLTHVTVRVSGEPAQLEAFDARLKVLCADEPFAGEVIEQHSTEALHYDLKVDGGVPFPPFALASGEFPALEIAVEWVNPGAGTRGSARIVAGMLTEHDLGNAAPEADHALAIMLGDAGYLTLALAVIRTGRDDYRGYALTGRQDALFRIVRDPATGETDLVTTQGAAEWSRAWHVGASGEAEYRDLDPPDPIQTTEFRELEALAQDFVARWIWFGKGPREEIAIELERYQRMGYTVSDANLRSSALHRIRSQADNGDGALRYSTLDTESQWVLDAVALCWARDD
jgi:hypothetical protein